MTRTHASDSRREADMSRRSFLDRTGKAAVGTWPRPPCSRPLNRVPRRRSRPPGPGRTAHVDAEPLRLPADQRPAGHQVAEQRARGLLGRAEHGVLRIPAACRGRRSPTSRATPEPTTATASASGGCWRCSRSTGSAPAAASTWSSSITSRRSRTPWSRRTGTTWRTGSTTHGRSTTTPIEQERAYWKDFIEHTKALTGKQVLGRLGGGAGYTVNTDDLMAEAGCLYHTSWIIDDQPFPIKVKGGQKFIYVPYTGQTNDAGMLEHQPRSRLLPPDDQGPVRHAVSRGRARAAG